MIITIPVVLSFQITHIKDDDLDDALMKLESEIEQSVHQSIRPLPPKGCLCRYS